MNRSNRVGRLGVFAAALFVVMALAGPTSALAQSVGPKDVQYSPPVLQVENSGNPGDPGETVAANSSGALPFTGLDLAAFVAIGIGLLATGIVIRRVTKPRQEL